MTNEHLKQTVSAEIEMKGKIDKELTDAEKTARLYTGVLFQSSVTISALCNNEVDVKSLIEALPAQIRSIVDDGPRTSEVMLAAHSVALNMVANMMLRTAAGSKTDARKFACMEMSFKSMDMMKKMLLAIDHIKRPRQQFTQNNIAGIQQISNNLLHEQSVVIAPNLENEKVVALGVGNG